MKLKFYVLGSSLLAVGGMLAVIASVTTSYGSPEYRNLNRAAVVSIVLAVIVTAITGKRRRSELIDYGKSFVNRDDHRER